MNERSITTPEEGQGFRTMSFNGGPTYDHLLDISTRYDGGERVHNQIIVAYDIIKIRWQLAMTSGDFSDLDDDFYDSLAAIELLIQNERVVEQYMEIFGHKPEPILK